MEEEKQMPGVKPADYQNIKDVYALLLVCPENSESKFVDRLKELGARGIVVMRGQGSAKPSIMELLGFDNNNKSIIFATAHDKTAHSILQVMEREFLFARGAGIGISIKAAGFAGARYLFRNFVTQMLMKAEEIKRALYRENILELLKTKTITEVLFSAEMAAELKDADAEPSDDIKMLIRSGKIYEIVNTPEYTEVLRRHGINADTARLGELTRDNRLQEIMKSAHIQENIKSGELLKIFSDGALLELFEEKGAGLFEADELKKLLKSGGFYDLLVSEEMRALIEEKGLARALKSKLMKSIKPNENSENDNKEQIMSGNKLIMTIVNRGFAEDVMEAARDKGAGGGTILGGRGTGSFDKSLFGIRIEPEKDIVMIIAKNEICKDIVEAVNIKAGLKTPGSGICFILPVDEVVGLTSIDSSELIK